MQPQEQVQRFQGGRPRNGFFIHLAVFVAVNALLVAINLMTSPEHLWFQWPLIGWGLGIFLHAALIKFLPNPETRKQRRLARELRKHERIRRRSLAN
jgi:hypothetical protein